MDADILFEVEHEMERFRLTHLSLSQVHDGVIISGNVNEVRKVCIRIIKQEEHRWQLRVRQDDEWIRTVLSLCCPVETNLVPPTAIHDESGLSHYPDVGDDHFAGEDPPWQDERFAAFLDQEEDEWEGCGVFSSVNELFQYSFGSLTY